MVDDAVGRCDVREKFIDGLTDNLLQRQLVTYKLHGNATNEQVASKVNGNENCGTGTHASNNFHKVLGVCLW